MEINYSIYYEKNGTFILLCKDVVLTEDLILKLKKIAFLNKNIYVPKELRSQILQKSNLLNNIQSEVESFEGYDEIKEDSKTLLDTITKDNIIPEEIKNEITKTVETTLDTVDVSLIIQSINSIRRVDEYLYTHSVNVALLNGLIGKWKNLDKNSIDTLVKIGLLHDIGKLRVPPHILNKPGKLTNEEFEEIKLHPSYSYEILKNSGEIDEEILLGVLQHHEKLNGSGYPNGLSYDSISTFARITSVSDIYDAMVSKRVYKEANSPFEVLAWFSEGRYSELDIEYVNIFLKCMTEELKGKYVLLSNGSVAEVIHVNPEHFEYPIVKINNEVILTNPELYCICMNIEKEN